MLLGLALPIGEWADLSGVAIIVVAAAVLLHRLVTLWGATAVAERATRPDRGILPQLVRAVRVSARLNAALAERRTGNHQIFVLATLAITCSVLVHGLTTVPLSAWLKRREPEDKQREEANP